jgi:hypothetical protein
MILLLSSFTNILTPLSHNSLLVAMSDPHEGKRKIELGWPIFRIHHQRCRYIYEMYYIKKKISKDLYEYCIREVMMQDTYRFVLSTAMFDKFFYPSLRPMSVCL